MWYAEKKGCPRERNLREIYTDTLDTIDTIETHYNVLSFVSFLCCFCLHITEYEQIRGGAQNCLGPRGVKYLNTGLARRRPRVFSQLAAFRVQAAEIYV